MTWMTNSAPTGSQLGTFGEVLDAVAAVVHHVRDQLVRLIQRSSGAVDELGLHGLPAWGAVVAEELICVTFAAVCPHLACVAGSESLPQVGAVPPPGTPDREQHDRDHRGDGVHKIFHTPVM
jgi:hypothetical protein